MERIRECCFKTIPAKDNRRLIWEITHSCKFNCEYCFQEKKRSANPARILHSHDLLKICSKMSALNITDVLITGGEIYYIRDTLEEICQFLQKQTKIAFYKILSRIFCERKVLINLRMKELISDFWHSYLSILPNMVNRWCDIIADILIIKREE
ncbi:MAG: hypothetical protein A2Z59_08570 [Nitrospinae bacterium RIFCSPLOWO2_02_39_17]|nr:MAG: hypothetical protein A2W53_00740 [Nitrospinae bacterium RIFCSPHIGHO2_02_39_11]OGV98773.1 MAG: hypothetical protein A3D97_08820 [Nitrospinae bacterium RIFCSPHIGHO2_12_FULL_39_42]OGW00587.1 MAG: hypothetical protein A3D20_01805 [Nitrospinae bacterium RIFCSPHIGHO2_02_FULL_39_82]OGW06496.1 MAG: hypothetical protein A2Z59_08570 [Nitrospinae bacterium RIFCSPLOWO2_02_39_17]OGW09147.1 MAG: hypothetical protein A2W75_05860 [Nitrospinae bacterium RIFCSPLOWO2_12_39_15]OGW09325.1 MAG: hypothetical